MAKASGLFPATRLKVSSTAAEPEPRLRGMDAELEPRPPRERRPAVPGPGPDGRCGGGRVKEWGRLAPVPRPTPPPPRASFAEPPYIERERRGEGERDLKAIGQFRVSQSARRIKVAYLGCAC